MPFYHRYTFSGTLGGCFAENDLILTIWGPLLSIRVGSNIFVVPADRCSKCKNWFTLPYLEEHKRKYHGLPIEVWRGFEESEIFYHDGRPHVSFKEGEVQRRTVMPVNRCPGCKKYFAIGTLEWHMGPHGDIRCDGGPLNTQFETIGKKGGPRLSDIDDRGHWFPR